MSGEAAPCLLSPRGESRGPRPPARSGASPLTSTHYAYMLAAMARGKLSKGGGLGCRFPAEAGEGLVLHAAALPWNSEGDMILLTVWERLAWTIAFSTIWPRWPRA